uniref:Vacuolar protein sorting-associated protein 37B-like n=1 Tax=Hirondellea gigas TaxID=1518452 RepID=A0A2P2I333_9CRUS
MEPDNEAAMGLIRHLTSEELKGLMNDESRLSEMVADLPQVRLAAQEQEVLLASNKSLAEYNMSLEPKLTEGRQALIAAYEEASTLADRLTTMKASVDSSSGQYKPDTIQALLQTAAHEMEEETEKLIERLLEKDLTVDEFLSEFIEKRTTAHQRRIKAEKVADMISSGMLSNGITAPAPAGVTAPPYTQLPYPTASQQPLPYPTSYNMPMPGY